MQYQIKVILKDLVVVQQVYFLIISKIPFWDNHKMGLDKNLVQIPHLLDLIQDLMEHLV